MTHTGCMLHFNTVSAVSRGTRVPFVYMADEVSEDYRFDPPPQEETRNRRIRSSAFGGAAVGILAIAGPSLIFASGTGINSNLKSTTTVGVREASTTAPPRGSTSSLPTASTLTPPGPLFEDQTDVVLVFDDGLEGVISVDPDLRLVARSHIDGQRAGDQPYRLHRTGNSLIVGWNTIYAIDITTGDRTRIGDATIFIPAAEPNAIWLVDYPGGSIGLGTPSVSLVNVTGNVIVEPTTLGVAGFPAIGIRGGIALETEDGVALWDATTNTVTERLGAGEGPGIVGDVAGSRFAWCTLDCQVLHVTDLAARTDNPTRGSNFVVRASRFTADGHLLAVPAGAADDEMIWIIDIDANRLSTVPSVGGDGTSIAWAPNGEQLFSASYGYGQDSMRLAWYVPETGQGEGVVLPFGGGIGFVVVAAQPTADPSSVSIEDDLRCPSPGTYNSVSPAVCSEF